MMKDAEIDKWYKKWCKDTKRNGGVLVGKSIKELLKSFNGEINSRTNEYYKMLTSFNKWSRKRTTNFNSEQKAQVSDTTEQ